MYVLIKQNSENLIDYVVPVPPSRGGCEGAMANADHIIRSELVACEYFGDIEFEDDSVPGNLLTCVASWVIDDAYWSLYEV